MEIFEQIIAIIAREASREANAELLAKLDSIENRQIRIEETMGILADKIKSLTAVETAEGAVLVKANADLKTALDAANAKVSALEPLAASVPALQSELDGIKTDLAAADEAANAIANINPTPVSDGIVEEVVGNPDIPTPPVVEQAPTPAPEVIQEQPVVDEAIDALEEAAPEVSPVSPG